MRSELGCLSYKRYYNLICVVMRFNLGWPLAPHWATISHVRLPIYAPTTASDQLYFVWDSSKGKTTGSDHCLSYKRYYNLICVVMRSNLLGWPPAAPHWATITYVALSIYAPSAASDQLYFVWDSSKGKSTGSDHCLSYKRYYNLTCVVMRSNLGWPPAPHWATITCVTLSIYGMVVTNYTLFGIVEKGNQLAQTTILPRVNTTTWYVLWRSNLGWPPAPHWATITYVALSTSASTAASDRI